MEDDKLTTEEIVYEQRKCARIPCVRDNIHKPGLETWFFAIRVAGRMTNMACSGYESHEDAVCVATAVESVLNNLPRADMLKLIGKMIGWQDPEPGSVDATKKGVNRVRKQT